MILARVIGTVVATRKDAGPRGHQLLLIQPLRPDGTPAGKPLVAVDSVGAGVGEEVFYVRGREAALPFLPAEVPTDAAIVGIVDHWNAELTAACRSRAWSATWWRRRRTRSSRARS